MSAQAQAVKPVKMVVGPDGIACEYIGETADKYHVMCQDDGWGDTPESAARLGLEKGWYKVHKDGVVDYVKVRTAWWSAKSLD